ncbi:hypothetical protein LZG04_06505 [Saccharothrix sp. S26]|uniref:hypothetical protein n=1 Tax=Saccharothrix sp. S26 TaxID=2907215 RepID=UPI001F29D23E|nr:hypothetical protein [Saccharothrix sp. S26]MCE6994459.1 hypothetical protein [Saccharothrix sp. S26]
MTSFDPVPWSQTTAVVLARQPSTEKDPGGQQEDFGKSSPLGLLILVLFFIAVFFLVKSMSKHLKKLPASFDEPEPEPEAKPEAKAGNGDVKKDD